MEILLTTRTNPRMIIVMRNDLGMRRGKQIAQASHAVLGAYKQALSEWKEVDLGTDDQGSEWYSETPGYKAFHEWDNNEFTKICVRVDSEEELRQIIDAAIAAKLNVCPIIDAGHTEFHGVPTLTCVAIGPHYPEELSPVTGHLKLL